MAARFVLIHPDRRYLALAGRVLQRSRAGVVEFYVLAFRRFRRCHCSRAAGHPFGHRHCRIAVSVFIVRTPVYHTLRMVLSRDASSFDHPNSPNPSDEANRCWRDNQISHD